jgi:catechol 2,3-dioxygenase-like lactoylglutathione lyase family enzyme
MIEKLDHVTMVVRNLEEAMKSYRDILHLEPWELGIVDHSPECRLVMLPTKSGARIEFIEPNPEFDSRFSRFLKERGEGVFGLSVYCRNFDREVASLMEKGVKVEEETQTFLFPERPFRLAWVPPREAHGVWVELVDAVALPDFEL